MTWIAFAIATAVVNLLVAEFAGWLPWIAKRILRRAARLVPADERDRYEDEWLGELEVLPGSGISAVIFAIQILVRAPIVRRELNGTPRAPGTPRVRRVRRREGTLLSPLAIAADFVLLSLALVMTLGGVRSTVNVASTDAPLLVLPPLVTLLLYLRRVHTTRMSAHFQDSMASVLGRTSVAVMTIAMIGILFNGQPPTQSALIEMWALSLLALGTSRACFALFQRWARNRRLLSRPVLIVGAGLVGSHIARRLTDHPEYGLAPVGFLDDNPRSVAEVGGRDLPVLGTFEDLDELVRLTGVRDLIMAFSSTGDARLGCLVQHCQELGIRVAVVPRMFDTINNRIGYDTIGGMPLLSFSSVERMHMQFAIKHTVDRLVAAVMLLVCSPLIVLAAIAVFLSSPGPVLFRQRRVGRDGTTFDLLTFRTLRINSVPAVQAMGTNIGVLGPSFGADVATHDIDEGNQRTLIGRFLHSTSLEELPQLFSVLRGDMSLIGPRPERPEFVELFARDIPRYEDRHRVKSGITGWAQVHGLRGQTSLAERVEWDNYYIAHWSLMLDLKIALLTLTALFRVT